MSGTCNQPHFGARCTEPAGHAGDHRDIEPTYGRTLARWPRRDLADLVHDATWEGEQ